MHTVKPIKISSHSSVSDKLTSAEMGKLWATYVGNSMSKCVLRYYLQNVSNEDIKTLLENALALSTEFIQAITDILHKENFPIPIGFTDEDVNLGAPRLFEDEFYVHYLKYVGKAGLSIYNVAVPLVYREDVRELFTHCMNSTMKLMEQINNILMNRNFIIKPPFIPVPGKIEFIQEDFLNGFLGHVRPLHALEIAHLYDNIENNTTSKVLLMAFGRVAKLEKIRSVFAHGEEITQKQIESYMEKLHEDNLPAPSFLDHLIKPSNFAPFSDKLMLFHKIDMFTIKIRSIGNSMAISGRHDLGLMYGKNLLQIVGFVEDAAKTLIENGWMEQPPYAAKN
jgi:hypothetical protein